MKWLFLPALCAAVFFPDKVVAAEAASSRELNEAFGLSLFDETSLWEEDVGEVAARLKWPQESQTSNASSYRLYPRKEMQVLGARPFSMVLHAEDARPVQLSMVFANKGDIAELQTGDPFDLQAQRAMREALRDYKRFIRRDSGEIEKRLTELLGEPQAAKVGDSRETRESVKRWDWNGHAILLAAPKDEYVAVRIVPVAELDESDKKRIRDSELREQLRARVVKHENGDVYLQDIPMVDQGPKGYCVPATFERALRYVGIPADMYVLAMAGNTEAGGGTSVSALMRGVSDLLSGEGRRLESFGGKVRARDVARSIDDGLPILWAMFVDRDLSREISARSERRKDVSDWKEWDESLEPVRKAARKLRANPDGAHICMIIGYNEETGEVAVSDSWGKEFALRWMTEEEAEAISQGRFYTVRW